LGIAYFLIRYEKEKGNQNYKKILSGLHEDLKRLSKSELLTGTCGQILGFLLIHEITKESFLIKKIDELVFIITKNVKIGKEGVFWDYAPYHYCGMTGFAHGNSGIAFVLFQLARYFQNNAWGFLAQQALVNENLHYHPQLNNWIDRRKRGTLDNFIEALSSGEQRIFKIVGNTKSWCYGSPGIMLARMEAYLFNNIQSWSDDLNRAYESANDSLENAQLKEVNSSLCHGFSGNILMVQIARDFLHKKNLDISSDQSMTVSNGKMDLFNGQSGNVYTSLYHTFKNTDSSILNPRVSGCFADSITSYQNLNISKENLIIELTKKALPLSFNMVKNVTITKDIEDHIDFKTQIDAFPGFELEEAEKIIYNRKNNKDFGFKSFVRLQYVIHNIEQWIEGLSADTALFSNPDFLIMESGSRSYLICTDGYPQTPMQNITEEERKTLSVFKDLNKDIKIKNAGIPIEMKTVSRLMKKGLLLPVYCKRLFQE
ncbi:MAG: lanthionine synthetase LanC family protein, partial [Cyclobacteriaceae bacterium]